MTKYDVLYEALQDQVDAGELSVETAEYLNDVAYEMYADEEVDTVTDSELLIEAVDYCENILEAAQDDIAKLQNIQELIRQERAMYDQATATGDKMAAKKHMKAIQLYEKEARKYRAAQRKLDSRAPHQAMQNIKNIRRGVI